MWATRWRPTSFYVFAERRQRADLQGSRCNSKKGRRFGLQGKYRKASGRLHCGGTALRRIWRLPPARPEANEKWRLAMKSLVWKAMVAGLILAGFLSAGARAQSSDNDGCSNATLKGDYAFTVSGTIWVTDAQGILEAVQRDGIAMTHFDGIENLSQVDYVLSGYNNLPKPPAGSPPPPSDPVTGFNTDEKG